MNPVEWYYARDNQQSGPISAAELKQLAAGGKLGPDDLVWREGMPEWAAAKNVRGLFDGAPVPAVQQPAPVAPQTAPIAPSPAAPMVAQEPAAPMRHPIDAMIDGFRLRCGVGRIDAISRFFRACGYYGMLVAMLLVAMFSVLMAIKGNPVSAIASGLAMLVVLAVLQYAAGKMCDALDRLNADTPGNLPTDVVPRVLSVLSKALGVFVLLSSVANAAQTSDYSSLLLGIAGFIVFGFLSMIAAVPAALNYTVGGEESAAEYALSVVTYFTKSLIRAVPAAFGLGVVCGILMIGYAGYMLISMDAEQIPAAELDEAVGMVKMFAFTAYSCIVTSALLPLMAFVLFLLNYLGRQLCRALLALPVKLDSLAEAKEPEQVDNAEETPQS